MEDASKDTYGMHVRCRMLTAFVGNVCVWRGGNVDGMCVVSARSMHAICMGSMFFLVRALVWKGFGAVLQGLGPRAFTSQVDPGTSRIIPA